MQRFCCLFLDASKLTLAFVAAPFWGEKMRRSCRVGLTVFRVHGEVGLSLQNAVDQLGAVPVRLIVGVGRSDGDNSRAYPGNTESGVTQQHRVKVGTTQDDKLLQNQ